MSAPHRSHVVEWPQERSAGLGGQRRATGPFRCARVTLSALAVMLACGAVLAGTAVAAPDYDGDGYADDDCAPLDPAVHPGAGDKPDLAFEDTNCDGIDGDESKAIFVTLGGDDAASGTRSNPMRTVAAGVAAADAAGKDVYIAAGSYETEPAGGVPLADDVGLYGGYGVLSGARSADHVTTIKGSPQALLAEGDTGVVLQLLTLEGTPGAALSAYGVRAVADGAGPARLALSKVTATGAAAGRGRNGSGGAPGSPGGGYLGGAGGAGGCGTETGQPGQPGEGSGPGADGAVGIDAAVVAAPDGSAWPLGFGSRGENGGPGAGGQGGTGGDGLFQNVFVQLCGGRGGDGGAGASGGAGGDGGQNGGGSFGAFIFNSSLVASGSTFAGGAGGAGGDGGSGGDGGAGAWGQWGSSGRCVRNVFPCASRGQDGSSGLPGGRGGGGGAGIGGPSFGIYQAGPESGFVAGEGTVISNGSGGEGGLPGSGGSRAAGGEAAELQRSATAPEASTADFDGDGFVDADDPCPELTGSASGCPVRPAKVSPPAPSPSDPAAGRPATGGGAPTTGAAAPARDTTPPTWSITAARVQRALKSKAITFSATPNESCSLTAVAKLGNKTLARTRKTLPGGAKSKIRLKLGGKARAALRKALRGRSQVTVVLAVKGVDASGNAATSTKKLRLKR
jgi:hypothetical protein